MSANTSKKSDLYPGSHVSRYYYFRDGSDNLYDPATTDVQIYDPSNVAILSPPTLTQVSLGKYKLDYDIPTDAAEGTWHVFVKGTYNNEINQQKFSFKVLKKLN